MSVSPRLAHPSSWLSSDMPTATARQGPLASRSVPATIDHTKSRSNPTSPQRKGRKNFAPHGNSKSMISSLVSDFTQQPSSTASSKFQDCLVTFADQYTSIDNYIDTMATQNPQSSGQAAAGTYPGAMRQRDHPSSASALPATSKPPVDWKDLYYQQQSAMDNDKRLHRLESEGLRAEIHDLTAQLQKMRNDSGYSTGTLRSSIFGGKENDKVYPDSNTIRASREVLHQIRVPSVVSPGGPFSFPSTVTGTYPQAQSGYAPGPIYPGKCKITQIRTVVSISLT